jgi:hypothetical protein
MRAPFSAPHFGIVHRWKIVEHQRGGMRQLHAARARQCDVQGIVTKDAAGGNGHDGTPAMSSSQSSVPGGFAHLGRRIHVKRGDEIAFDRSAHVGFLGREVLKLDIAPPPTNFAK